MEKSIGYLSIKSFCARQKATNEHIYTVIVPVTEIISIHNCITRTLSSFSLAFQSTYQILWRHLKGLLSLRVRLLPFSQTSDPLSFQILVFFPFSPFCFSNSHISCYSNVDDYPLSLFLVNYYYYYYYYYY